MSTKHDEEMRKMAEQTMRAVMKKLQKVADEGPYGDDIVLTRNEAMLVFRLLNRV